MPRPDQRPNILFVMFDQMAALSLPVYGHPIVQAPHVYVLIAFFLGALIGVSGLVLKQPPTKPAEIGR